MYLRYREPSWETAEVARPKPARRRGIEGAGQTSAQGTYGTSGSQVQKNLPVIDLLGVKVHAITEIACVEHVLDAVDSSRGGVVITPNLDHLRRYLSDVNFGALVAEADLVVADGMPLVWASRLQGTPLPERVAGSNLISSLSAGAAGRGRSVFLLGGAPGTAEGASKVLTTRHPNLKVAGWHFPPVGFEQDPAEMARVMEVLSTAKPDIVYVALGSPKQERLIARLRPILPNSWWLGVGNSFSFLCGDVRRAPLWMQKTGLEWSHRLFQEPKRLFKRYVVVGVPFAASLLGRSFVRGIPYRLGRPRPGSISAPAIAPQTLVSSPVTFARIDGPLVDGPLMDGTHAPTQSLSADPSRAVTSSIEAQLVRSVWPSASSQPEKSADETLPLSRLRALVLLGGSVRANTLCSGTGRAVLDLPLDESGSLLNFWLAQAAEVARSAGLEKLPVRVMVNQNSPEPRSADARYIGAYRVERDLSEYRGTGGVLHDLANDYDDDDLILVANAAQVLLDPLTLVATALQRKRGDVGVISHEDGTPSGIMLVTRKTLRLLPSTGFVDMKEQGLPLIASKYDVRVVKRRRPTGLPVRSLEGYIQALHYYHRRRSGTPAAADPLAEDWSPSFSLIEPGATVDPTARIHDSVVLAGATVEPGAVLVRSVACPGTVIRRDRTAVDRLVTLERESKRAFRDGRNAAAAAAVKS
ncbi:MAG: putative glycosyltransferase [Phycisphaerales bacterium]|nr:putative glycosyltransferase [Phycisphaerales bacterium]